MQELPLGRGTSPGVLEEPSGALAGPNGRLISSHTPCLLSDSFHVSLQLAEALAAWSEIFPSMCHSATVTSFTPAGSRGAHAVLLLVRLLCGADGTTAGQQHQQGPGF